MGWSALVRANVMAVVNLNLFANIDTTHVYYNVLHGLSASGYHVLSSNGPCERA